MELGRGTTCFGVVLTWDLQVLAIVTGVGWVGGAKCFSLKWGGGRGAKGFSLS